MSRGPGHPDPANDGGVTGFSGRFRDRSAAGRTLGAELASLALDEPVVVALPRGGVPVAVEVARALQAPLDVIVVRKLGLPGQPELAMGAVGEGGVRVLEAEVLAYSTVDDQLLDAVTTVELAEVDRRLALLRGARPALGVDGRTVVVVDDGVATGSTVRAAAAVLRARGVGRLVLAVPVAPVDTVDALRDVYDDVRCVSAPEYFGSVGSWYEDFHQLTDTEVRRLLDKAETD